MGFLATGGTGKSTLAAFLSAAGHALVSDDILILEPSADGSFLGRPSYPSLRLRDAAVAPLLGRAATEFPLLHPESDKRRLPVGAFASGAVPLAALYLLERGEAGGAIEIDPVPPRQALIELLRHSFLPRMVEALGLAPARLETLARLVEKVPVRRLRYPTGYDRLAEVRAALVAEHGS